MAQGQIKLQGAKEIADMGTALEKNRKGCNE